MPASPPITGPLTQVPAKYPETFFQQLRLTVIGVWQMVLGGFQAGFAAAPVASAATIALTTGWTIVSGTATIQTITPPAGLVAGVIAYLLAAPGATWSVGTGGNVSNAVGPVTAGLYYPFAWDGTKWHPAA